VFPVLVVLYFSSLNKSAVEISTNIEKTLGILISWKVKLWACSVGWCWFVPREEYCWLVAGGWFDLREKYCWQVADKPSEHAVY
jgi:hypothetical protein